MGGLADTCRVNPIDLLAIALLVIALLLGIRSGALPQVFGLVGAGLGVILAVVVLPLAASQLDPLDATVRVAVVLGVIFVALGIGEAAGSAVGADLRDRLGEGFLGTLDRAAGGLVGFGQAVIVVWLLGGVIALSAAPGITAAAQQSTALRTIDQLLPPPTVVTNGLHTLIDASGLPDLFVGLEPLPAPPVATPPPDEADRIARAALASTVQVNSQACGSAFLGTGFAVGTGYVVTNAHVIAGGSSITVSTGSRTLAAEPVLFDPDLDIALLRVPGFRAPALTFARSDPTRGTFAAALGHPGGAPLTIVPATVSATYEAEGRDLYDQTTVTRDVIELDAAIRRGDSGGPLVLPDGTIGGVVFAESRTSPNVGYALSGPAVAARVMPAVGSTTQVGTGPCTT